MECLGGSYEVEPGHGANRNAYLRDHSVQTYFIIPPPRRRKVSNLETHDYTSIILATWCARWKIKIKSDFANVRYHSFTD